MSWNNASSPSSRPSQAGEAIESSPSEHTRPYIGIAVLCQSDQRMANGSLSLFGVSDRMEVVHVASGLEAVPVPRRLVLRFYNPSPRGEHTIQVYYWGTDQYRHGIGQLVAFDALVTTVAFDLRYTVGNGGDWLLIEVWVDRNLATHMRLPIDTLIEE